MALNAVGGAAFAWLATVLGPGLGIVDEGTFGDIARRLSDKPSDVMFLSAVAAGWLMGLLAWLTTAARDTISQIVAIWLTTAVIGLAGLHHSIAGTIEVLMGVFGGEGVTMASFWRFLALSVAGNAVGGAAFVALLKFGHVRQSAG